MKITPLDIQQIGFKVRIRGYDRREVDGFLDSVTEEYEGLIRENSVLKEKLADFEGQVAELKKKEIALNNTLVKAQDLVEGMKHTAQKDADLVLKEAELKAEGLARLAHEEVASIRGEILDIKKQKAILLEKVRSMVRTFDRVIQMEDEMEEPGIENGARAEALDDEKDDTVRLIRPKT